MVKQCKCGNNICCLEETDQVECKTCGCIFTNSEDCVQIGVTKYKFPDINYEYVHVFESEEEVVEFIAYVSKNAKDYEYCIIITPIEESKIVENGNLLL